jgi:hypothetical protein
MRGSARTRAGCAEARGRALGCHQLPQASSPLPLPLCISGAAARQLVQGTPLTGSPGERGRVDTPPARCSPCLHSHPPPVWVRVCPPALALGVPGTTPAVRRSVRSGCALPAAPTLHAHPPGSLTAARPSARRSQRQLRVTCAELDGTTLLAHWCVSMWIQHASRDAAMLKQQAPKQHLRPRPSRPPSKVRGRAAHRLPHGRGC